MDIIDEDMDISLALQYWYKTGSKEVIKFNEKEFIDKAAVEKKILFCKGKSWTGIGSSPQQGLMKTTWAMRHS